MQAVVLQIEEYQMAEVIPYVISSHQEASDKNMAEEKWLLKTWHL